MEKLFKFPTGRTHKGDFWEIPYLVILYRVIHICISLKNATFQIITGILGLSFILHSSGCRKEDNSITQPVRHNTADTSTTYDVDTKGIPKFVSINYIELEKIGNISRFRSAIGHDYSDNFESCRSMKHYFEPKESGVAWDSVKLYSPIDGKIVRLTEEWAGTKISIQSKLHPAFTFDIFHVHRKDSLVVGDSVYAGQLFGTHIGNQTYSDVAVSVQTPAGWKLISYIYVITDSLFLQYQNRGVQNRDSLVISKQARDADTLHCNGESFLNTGTLSNWFSLN